jgi:predicted HTH domain antitoxin
VDEERVCLKCAVEVMEMTLEDMMRNVRAEG